MWPAPPRARPGPLPQGGYQAAGQQQDAYGRPAGGAAAPTTYGGSQGAGTSAPYAAQQAGAGATSYGGEAAAGYGAQGYGAQVGKAVEGLASVALQPRVLQAV